MEICSCRIVWLIKEMHHTVFQYIEVTYSRIRRHSANGRFGAMAFEAFKAA